MHLPQFTPWGCVQVLARAGILSAPVFISPDLEDMGQGHILETQPQRELLGWLDMNDILRFFLDRAYCLMSVLREILENPDLLPSMSQHDT